MLAHAWGSPPLDHATAALLSARVKTLSAAYWVSGIAGVGPTQPEGVSRLYLGLPSSSQTERGVWGRTCGDFGLPRGPCYHPLESLNLRCVISWRDGSPDLRPVPFDREVSPLVVGGRPPEPWRRRCLSDDQRTSWEDQLGIPWWGSDSAARGRPVSPPTTGRYIPESRSCSDSAS